MNEQMISELFNAELDALLRSGKERSFLPDPGAIALAAELARADFSGQSLIKESLRARLNGEETVGFFEKLRALFSANYARAALAAAVLAIALLPLARRHAGRAPEVPAPPAIAGRPFQARAPFSRLPAAPEPSVGGPAGGFFASIPMAALEAEPLKDFPIASAGAGSPVVLAAGREVKLENGSGLVFETGSGVFILERRVINPEDIFERRVL